MRGKITGALSLIGFVILLKNPQTHDALNEWVEDAARKIGSWIPGVRRLRRRSGSTQSEAEPESLPETVSATPTAPAGKKRIARRAGTGPKKAATGQTPKAKRGTTAAKDGR